MGSSIHRKLCGDFTDEEMNELYTGEIKIN